MNPEDWKSFEKVSLALVVDSNKRDKIRLRYNKYKNLDLDNLKEIMTSRIGLTRIPKEIMEKCSNLKVLELKSSKILEVWA